MKRGQPLKRKTPLRSRTPLKARSWLRRRTPLRRVNPERRMKRQLAGLIYGDYHRWIGTRHCCVENSDCWKRIRGHHVITVGSGGEDYGNEAPLCDFHHYFELPDLGREAFEEKHEVDLTDIARNLATIYPGKAA